MIVIIAFFGGIRNDHLLLALFALSFCTMTYGWVTEALSRPDPDSRQIPEAELVAQMGSDAATVKGYLPPDSEEALAATYRMTQWEIGATGKRDVLVLGCFRWSGPLQRLGPNLLGYVPYTVAWYIILDTFYWNISRLPEGNEGPPDFVHVLVWGQFLVFSSFAVTSLVQQSSHWGCRNYYWGEISYLILSIVSKGKFSCNSNTTHPLILDDCDNGDNCNNHRIALLTICPPAFCSQVCWELCWWQTFCWCPRL